MKDKDQVRNLWIKFRVNQKEFNTINCGVSFHEVVFFEKGFQF
jgi:hypothetical protein